MVIPQKAFAFRRELFTRCIPFTMALSSIRIPEQNGDVGLIFATYLCEIADESSIRLSDEHIRFDWTTPKKTAELLATSDFPAELTEKIHMLHTKCTQEEIFSAMPSH
ncbi:MAG: hypothetical protein KR126chlam3_00708 [Chlamydiae bacterium]|nr:hypothetical protein [Chlamydiota bacterium]